MVLTTVPQTALPVLAEEANQIEAQAETDPEVVNKDATKDIADDTESDGGETISDEDDSKDSTPEDGETKTEGDDESTDGQGEDQAAADDKSKDGQDEDQTTEDDQDASDEAEAGSDEELTDETKPAEEETKEEVEFQGNEIDSLEPESTAKSTIVLQERTGAGDTLAQGVLSTAEIQFTDGCASEDGTEVRKDSDITFLVLPNDGYKLKSLGYAAAEDKGTFTKDTALTPITLAGEGPYTVPKAQLAGDKSVLIAVETEEINFNLTASGATLNKVDTAEDGAKSLKAFTDADKKVAKSDAASIEFAIEVPAGKTYIVTAQAAGGEESDPITGTEGTIGEGNTAKKYMSYTLDATTLDGVEIGNDDIAVTVKVEEVVAKTVNAAVATVGTGFTLTPVTIGADATDAQKAYKPFVNSASASAYNAGDKVAFVLTPAADSDYDLDGIEAKLTKGVEEPIELDKAEDITKTFFPDEAANTAKNEAYFVTIPATLAENGYALDLTVKTKLARNKTTIKFTSNKTDVLSIEGGTGDTLDDVEADTEYSVLQSEGPYKTAISSREGYQITKAEVTVKGTNGDTSSDTFTHTYTLDENAEPDKNGSKYPRYMIDEQSIDLSGTGTPGADPADSKQWKATEVTINIEVSETVEGADEEKTVGFTNNSSVAGGIPYALTVVETDAENDKVTYTGTNTAGSAVIAENTPYLSFKVAADTEPDVVVDLGNALNDEDDTKLLEVTKKDGGYEYQIPAKAFIGDAGSVTITRGTATIKADVPGNNADVEYNYTENGKKFSNYDKTLSGTATVDIDANVNFTVTQQYGAAPITGVTWQYDEDGAPTPVAESGDGYKFTAKASKKPIIVKVAYATDERIFVSNGDYETREIDPNDTEPVDVDYERKISAYVKAGDGTNLSLINAMVYDGTKLAQTKATVTDDVAVIETIAESEQGKPLTVTLVKADRTKVSFNIKPDKKAEEVSYDGLEGGNLTLGVDMCREIWVDVKDAKAGKLAAAVIEDTTELPKTVTNPATANANISAYYDYDEGYLYITALSKDAGVDKAGVVVLYRTTDNGIVSGSAIRVKTEAPFMKGENVNSYNPTGTVVGRNYTVAMNEASLQAVAEKSYSLVYSADAYYTVKVTPGTWTAPEGMEAADFNRIKEQINNHLRDERYTSTDGRKVPVGEMLAKNGYSIELIPKDVAPLELSFEVEITPVQVLAGTGAVIKGTSWKSGAISTAKVNYSETLKLGKGESKLTTGRNEDIVVATPEFAEGGNNRYNWVVDPVFINNKTKVTYGSSHGGLEASWNPAKGTVTVNAADAKAFDNKYFNDYKDLAIKITVFTETGDYGVSGTKKLTVQNGIEDLSLTVQPEILYKGKKLTVNTATSYNTDNGYDDTFHDNYPSYYTTDYAKYRAPQKKAATYEIGNVGKALAGKVSINPTNGKITLEQGITLSNKEADNQFEVIAKANDYETNDTWSDWETVTVIGEVEKLNELALFDVNDFTSKAKKLEVTNGSTFEVNSTSGQYKVAVLKDDAKANADGTYNLDNVKNVYDTNLLTFTSSNKGIKVYSDGSIEVNKVGKTTITAALKSEKKEKQTLKNVNFVVENQPIVAKLTQYENSDFSKAFAASDNEKYFEQNGNYAAKGSTTTGYYSLEFCKKVTDENGEVTYPNFTLPNYSVSFGKNAKKAVNKVSTNDKVYFTATGAASTVTITNKEKAYKTSNKIVININNAADANLQNAPKVQLLTDNKNPIIAGKKKELNVKVTPAKKTDTIWDAEKSTYVILSIDQSKKTKATVNNVFSGYLDRTIALSKVGDAEGRLDLEIRESSQAENYTLIVTMGTMENGVFTQTHKEARLNIKPKAANAKIKATAKYTLNPYGANKLPFVVSGGDYDVWFTNDDLDGNFAQNVIMKGGEPNEFNRFFEITGGDNVYYDYEWRPGVKGSTIAIKQDLTDEELKLLGDKDYMKNNLTGYVSVSNGQQELDVKVTVALKTFKDMKLKAQATPTVTGKVVTDIQVLNGKEPVDIEAYSISGNSLDFKPYYTKDMGDTPEQKEAEAEAEAYRLERGIIRVVAEDAKKGNQKFDLKVVTKDTADRYKYAEVDKNGQKVLDTENCLLTNAVTVSGSINVVETKNAKNKIVFAKGATNWKVSRNDWWANADNEAGTPWYGWSTERTYTFKNRLSGVAKVQVETDKTWAYVDGDDYSDNSVQWLNISIDKKELESKMTAERLKWGKNAKVKATFSYLDRDGKTLDIPKDTVTFTITLPEEPGFENAASLYTEVVKNQAKLQNLADKKFKEHLNEHFDDAEYGYDDAAKDVRWDLLSELQSMAKGTTAMLDVTWEPKDGKYVFTLHVEGQTVDVSCAYEADLGEVVYELNIIRNKLGNSDDAAKKQAEDLGLKYSPMTEAGALQTKLKEILDGKRLLTNSMSISVERVDGSYNETTHRGSGTYAPTDAHGGQFVARVTVVDRSVRSGSYNTDSVVLNYSFDQLSSLSVYKEDGLKSIKTKLNSTKLEELINKAYFKLGKGVEDHVFSPEMEDALRAEIETFAGTLIEDKDKGYLSVAEVNKASFTVENDEGSSQWKVSFTITYNNATPDTKEPTFDVEVSNVRAAYDNFKGGQTARELKTAAETAMDDKILPATCTTKDAAIAAIKKIITDEIKNPAYKAAAQLKVELNGVESEAFKAPVKEGETTTAGWINVKVTYDATAENDVNKLVTPYTFTIGSTVSEGGETVAQALARVETRVKAILTPSVINAAVETAYKNERNNYTADDVKTAVGTALVTEAAKASEGITVTGISSWTDPDVTMGDITLPEDETDGTYADITVTLKYNDGSADKTKDITITGGALAHGDKGLYQSETKYRDALEKVVKEAIIPYSDSYYADDQDDGLVADKSSIVTGIDREVKRIAALDTVATNPKWKTDAYKAKISAAAGTDPVSAYTLNEQSKRITVTNVVLTIGDASDAGAKDNIRTVTVRVGGTDDQSLVDNITITKIGDTDVPTTGDKDGSTAAKAVEITAPEEDVVWPLEATVTGTGGLTETDKVVSWELYKDADDGAWSDVTDGNVATKIARSSDGKKLEVKSDAYTESGSVTGYLKATAAGSLNSGADKKKSTGIWVKIILPEKPELTVKAENGTDDARTRLEAPAGDTPVEYTYKAVLGGSHVKDSTKTKVEFDIPAAFDPADAGVTFENPDGDKTKLKVSVAKTAKQHDAVKLTAKVKNADPAVTGELSIDIVAQETLQKAAKIELNATGMTDVDWNDGLLVVKNQDVKDVKIPFTINDGSRDWMNANFTVKVKTSAQGVGNVGDTLANITAAAVKSGKDKGKYFLTIKNEMPEIKSAAAATDDAPAVVAPEFTLTAAFTGTNGKADVTTTLDFKLEVQKKFTGINFSAKYAEDDRTNALEDPSTTGGRWVVAKAATGDTKVSFADSVLKGAHVSGEVNLKGFTWTVTGNAGSIARMDRTSGILTIPATSKDNILTVRATKKISETETITRETKIKVTTASGD